MFLRRLAVTDFRSWSSAAVEFEAGPNVLVGANGQGKTNLVEALMYLTSLTSHRTATDAPLVRMGTARAAVAGVAVSEGRELRVEIEITPGKANRVRRNGVALPRARNLLGAVRAVLFAPEDVAIIRGDPAERRRFLDELLVARRPRLATVRADYERVLRQRAALLRTAGSARRAGDLRTLDVWDAHLASAGSELIVARLETLAAVRPHAAAAYAQVAPSAPRLGLSYASSVPGVVTDASATPADKDVEAALLGELALLRPQELERGVTLVGPHRDDMLVTIGPLPARAYASHGESWSAALALRLGSYDVLRDEDRGGGDPILVLDDVFAELDDGRRAQLALAAGKAEQAVITAAVASDVPSELSGARFDVVGGTVRRAG